MNFKRTFTEIAFHAVMTAGVALLFMQFFFTELSVNVAMDGVMSGDITQQLLLPAFIIILIASAVWGMLYIGVLSLTRRKLQVVHLRPTTGSVIIETLIVLPIYLLFTFGLMQMAVNSMAGILTTVGTYNAARTLAVWGPERGHNRTGTGVVTAAQIEEKGRAAVAAIIAPVVPTSATPRCAPVVTIEEMLIGMVGHGVNPLATGSDSIVGLSHALDQIPFADRAAMKLRNAYCATRISGHQNINANPNTLQRTRFTLRVSYTHPLVIPVVGAAFRSTGGQIAPVWQTANVTVVNRRYEYTSQISPNPELPSAGIIAAGLDFSRQGP